tara:strand:+ start:95 stop:289 length:195 start_codon:yes stop_codon:yes gene_type:complete
LKKNQKKKILKGNILSKKIETLKKTLFVVPIKYYVVFPNAVKNIVSIVVAIVIFLIIVFSFYHY